MGPFGQFLTKTFIHSGHTIIAIDKDCQSAVAQQLGCESFYPLDYFTDTCKDEIDNDTVNTMKHQLEPSLSTSSSSSSSSSRSKSGNAGDVAFPHFDVLVIAVSIMSFEEVMNRLKSSFLDFLQGKLVVDVLSVKQHPKQILLQKLAYNVDILCTHPMFGPSVHNRENIDLYNWSGLKFVYSKVRIR